MTALSLNYTAEDNRKKNHVLSDEDSFLQLLKFLTDPIITPTKPKGLRISASVMINSEGSVIGLYSQVDVLNILKTKSRELELSDWLRRQKVHEWMTKSVATISEDMTLDEVSLRMDELGIRTYPVVSKNSYIGMIEDLSVFTLNKISLREENILVTDKRLLLDIDILPPINKDSNIEACINSLLMNIAAGRRPIALPVCKEERKGGLTIEGIISYVDILKKVVEELENKNKQASEIDSKSLAQNKKV
jgi:CBS domain-containing protein